MKLTAGLEGVEGARAMYEGMSERRIRAAVAVALTRTARDIEVVWLGQLDLRFDRPTRDTRRSTLVIRAEASTLSAVVKVKDVARTPDAAPATWLTPQEFGGGRRVKKFERALQAQGAMPAGWQVVPGRHAKLDAYGNISRAQIVQVLNQLGTDLSPGYARVIGKTQAKRLESARRSGRIYVAFLKAVGPFEPGIYLRAGRRLLSVFVFKPRTEYTQRLELIKAGTRVGETGLRAHVERSLSEQASKVGAVR